MSDQDYIRKAVELADGWSWDDDDPNDICILPPESSVHWPVNTDGGLVQFIPDALAAQLVRQVDVLDKVIAISSFASSAIMCTPDKKLASGAGSGRTMNTIKTIVDSKVLEAT